ncbi:MAG: CBS domain-containing protein [Clostridiales bacterium]|uniref:CBS domain-containing protein n=1 Tax=Clostridium sp. N3C TaxID=1776758 RepID=UPI00092DFD36|nr:CBS domain-containing protein [Clostridium sp. N3C]NLZ48624.1 CBS domain-containing protein [Clostridiales bacterium]SCN22640.1 putative manganese-dependent inorganic pyrophosphatase [Clostridium sp. N3C]
MKIHTLMTKHKHLSTVSSQDSLQTALEKMRETNIKSIPVVDKKKFLGIIFKDKILELFLTDVDSEKRLREAKVESLIESIPTLGEDSSFEHIVNTLRENDAEFVSIVDKENNFLGIIPHKAIFDEMVNIMGLNNGRKLTIYLHDIPGQLAKVSQIVAKNRANVQNLIVRNPKTKLDIREMILRVDESVVNQLKSDLEKAGYRVEC